MNRREIIALSSVILSALPDALSAQIFPHSRKIGVLWGGVNPQTPLATALTNILLNTLRERGWIDGQNIHIEARWLPTIGRLKDAAKELLEIGSEVIVVNSSPLLREVMAQTSSVPIVFVRVVDPVGQGFVRSLSSSGNNVTGFMHFYPEVAVKWLQILK